MDAKTKILGVETRMRFFAALIVVAMLVGCVSAPVPAPIPSPTVVRVAMPTRVPTATPEPTLTPFPTRIPTARPTSTPSTRSPSWNELQVFLSREHTNWTGYSIKRGFVCLQFARSLITSATKAGITAGLVTVYFVGEDIGHAFVWFDTLDGRVWIEPQSDFQYIRPGREAYAFRPLGQRPANGWGYLLYMVDPSYGFPNPMMDITEYPAGSLCVSCRSI